MKNKYILAALVAAAVSFASAIQAQSKSDNVTSEDVKKETQALISTLSQYSAAQREEAIKTAEQALKELDGRIDELENRVDSNWDKMNQASREKTRASLKTLRKQRNELAEWYGGFKNSSLSAWEQMKKGFSDAYQAVGTSWDKAWAELTSDKK